MWYLGRQQFWKDFAWAVALHIRKMRVSLFVRKHSIFSLKVKIQHHTSHSLFLLSPLKLDQWCTVVAMHCSRAQWPKHMLPLSVINPVLKTFSQEFKDANTTSGLFSYYFLFRLSFLINIPATSYPWTFRDTGIVWIVTSKIDNGALVAPSCPCLWVATPLDARELDATLESELSSDASSLDMPRQPLALARPAIGSFRTVVQVV